VPFETVKTAARPLPAHIDLSGRRSFHGHTNGAKLKAPPSFRPPQPPKVEPSWSVYLHHLRDYSLREGHTNIPLGYEFVQKDSLGNEVDGQRIRLGVWLSKQWTEYQAKRLSNERTIRLANAGVNWDGPAPPADGLVGPRHLNERKWDTNREEVIAQQNPRRPFDARAPPAHQRYLEYDAEADPHTRRWRREHGVTQRPRSAAMTAAERLRASKGAPRSIEAYVSGAGFIERPRGLPPELGERLQKAKHALQAERAAAKGKGAEQIHPHDL